MRYLSLSWKIMLLMLSMLLLLLGWFTSLSLLHMNDQFNRQQALRKVQGQQYFQLYNRSVDQQLLTWMQTFAELQQVTGREGFSQLAAALPGQTESLQLNFALRQLVLFGPEQQVLYQNNTQLSEHSSDILQRTIRQQSPQAVIRCDTQCYKLLTLPLLDAQGNVAVLFMITELTDVLFNLHQTLGTEVALLSYQPGKTVARQFDMLQASNRALMAQLYQQLPDDVELGSASSDGIIIAVADLSYYLHLIPLDPDNAMSYQLLMVEDVSSAMQDKKRYQRQILLVAAGCFVAVLVLILFITRRVSSRILQLAAALPLLAQRRYNEFRYASQLRGGLLQDELTTFNHSVLNLSYELEHLDLRLADNTAALEKIAMFDPLTGLANRNLLQQQLRAALAGLPQHSGYVGLLFLDLDKFKTINNSRSHATGDLLLIETAQRLQSLCEGDEVVCRFGGDEFALVMPHMSDPQQAEVMAWRVLALFDQPFLHGQGAVSLSASIGISFTPDPQLAEEELIRRADLAMYQAKSNGRNCYYVFNEQMSFDLANRLQLEAELRQAIRQHQFSLSLQPKVNLRSGGFAGFEALLRWHHPVRGMVSPDEFITVLEQAQLIVDVGYWVFERCCQLSNELADMGLPQAVIALNMSADQFLQPDLPDRFGQLMQRYNVSGQQFELELTESTLVSHVSQTLDVMHQLKAQGFSFAIDDFGTGYSSLNYLKRMPVDTIKIDKSFVQGMLDNPSDYQIIASTIAMVQKLGLQVVAEGVESYQQLQLLQQHHCDLVQGFYFSRPLCEAQLAAFVSQVTQHKWPAQLLR